MMAVSVGIVLVVSACGGRQKADETVPLPPRARFGNLDTSAYEVQTQDWNLDGRPDGFLYSGASGVVMSQRDLDFDGRIEFYEYYDGAGRVVEREFQLDFDDAIDAVHVFVDGVLARKELSIDFDGRPSMFKYYDSRGNLLRVERDRDGDGVVDQFGYYEGGRLVRVGVDTNGDGRPDDIEAYD